METSIQETALKPALPTPLPTLVDFEIVPAPYSRPAPGRKVSIGCSSYDAARLADLDVCSRPCAVGIGNKLFLDLTLPGPFRSVQDHWHGVGCALSFDDEQGTQLAHALFWSIAINPEKCLRTIDPVTGQIAAAGPAFGDVFNWTYHQSYNPGAPDHLYLDWSDGIMPDGTDGKRLWLYGWHNNLIGAADNVVGSGRGPAFVTLHGGG